MKFKNVKTLPIAIFAQKSHIPYDIEALLKVILYNLHFINLLPYRGIVYHIALGQRGWNLKKEKKE